MTQQSNMVLYSYSLNNLICPYTPINTTSQDIIVYAVDGDDNLYSEFFGSGVPFGQTDLQPVDPNLIRNVLYKFDRPLTMVEINNILNATSNPISIGRRDDPLSTIPAHIKSINIDSVIKQTAKFDLRSNKILR